MPPPTTFPSAPGPEFIYEEELDFLTIISELEGQQEQRRNKRTIPRRKFRLLWKVLVTADIDILFNFFIARKGAFEAFNFVNLNDSVTYIVRFELDTASKQRFSGALFSTGLVMIEVNDPT